MIDWDFEEKTLAKAREIIATKPSDWVVKTYYGVLALPVEMLRASNTDNKNGQWLIETVDGINKNEDAVRLVGLALIYNVITIKSRTEDKGTPTLKDVSEDNLSSVRLSYEAFNSLINKEITTDEADSKSDDSGKNSEDFERLISITVGRLYKKSPLWKQKLMWQLVKEWNSPKFNSGIGRLVREKLGEDEALAIFRQTVNEIINNSELLNKAINDYHEANPYAN